MLDRALSATEPISGPLAGIKRHPEFWLDDGNLILVTVYDGCPVVPVHDTPGEFAHFLRVLMPKDTRK